MSKNRSGKKNKNAVIQYNTPVVAPLDPSKYDDDGRLTSLEEQTFPSEVWGQDGGDWGRCNAGDNTQAASSKTNRTTLDAVGTGVNNGTFEDTVHGLLDFATSSPINSQQSGQGINQNDMSNWPDGASNYPDQYWQNRMTAVKQEAQHQERPDPNGTTSQAEEIDLSNYPWPGSKADQAENSDFWKQYYLKGKDDEKERSGTFNIPSNELSGRNTTSLQKHAQGQSQSQWDNRDMAVDEPWGAFSSHQSAGQGQGHLFDTGGTTTTKPGTEPQAERQKKGYGFHDMAESYLRDQPNLPQNAPIQPRGNGHYHCSCGRVHYVCPHLRKGTAATTPVKPARKKNVTAGGTSSWPTTEGSLDTASGAGNNVSTTTMTNTTSTAAIAGPTKSSSYLNRYQETSTTLGELVLIEGLVVKDVHPDGNCLFAAVVDQLRIRGEFFYTARSLREVAVTYLRENPCQEDGTPLKMFLTEHDGTWDQYLARMSREGEWGDHFVISALANVLKRRLVILRGFDKLTRTVMEPSGKSDKSSKPETLTEPADKQDSESGPSVEGGTEGGIEKLKGEEQEPGSQSGLDDLYIGHIAEAHYVSLRYVDWEDRLQKCLEERKVPSYLKYGPDTAEDQEASTSGTQVSLAFPEVHLDFLLKYISNGYFIIPQPPMDMDMDRDKSPVHVVVSGDRPAGLEPGGNLLGIAESQRSSYKSSHQEDKESSLWDFSVVELWWVPDDTVMHFPDGNPDSFHKKDLIALEMEDRRGFTKLIPVMAPLWLETTEKVGDIVYLKHLPLDSFYARESQVNRALSMKSMLAFQSGWPRCAKEFLSRARPNRWPSKHLLEKNLRTKGVHVVPEASPENNHNEIEWKFSFKNAEKMLCRWMQRPMKYSYFYFKIVSEFLFREKQYQFDQKDTVCKPQLKAVFFRSCEELPLKVFEDQPGHCLLYMLKKLQGHLEQRFLPDYFMSDLNLVANVDDHILQWHAEQIAWFRKYYLENIFLLFDRSGLMNHFGLGKCLETLISDAQKFVVHRSVPISYRESFLSLNTLCMQNWVKMQRFDKARVLFDSTLKECTVYDETLDPVQDILQKALDDLPLQEKWLFAFYMDLLIGSKLVQVACKDHECAPLENIFGEDCKNAVAKLAQQVVEDSFRVPMTIIYSENVVPFAESFTRILRDEDESKQAFKTATRFFLQNNTRDLLLSIEKEERDRNYHTGHDNTKSKLKDMFDSLYQEYEYEKRWQRFADMMEDYDLLSKHYQHARLQWHVASMWEYFGNVERYNEAMTRYKSLVAS